MNHLGKVKEMGRDAWLRTATQHDLSGIIQVYHAAFGASESAAVSTLAADLLEHRSQPGPVSIVAVDDDRIVGHVAFSPVWLAESSRHIGYILAPLAVAPGHQGRGIGSKLVRHGLTLVGGAGLITLVYGDPNYYARFGFTRDLAQLFIPPYELEFPFGWQAMRLADTVPVAVGAIRCVAPLMKQALW